MSRTYNMVGGGGSSQAVLAVTVTNGTPTSVTATKTGSSVSLVHDSTNDIWTGNVTPGTWTVTATDGTNSGSISVTVDEVKVYSRIIGMSELGGDYTKLEWISSTGADINTGYSPVSACKIFAKFQILQNANWTYPFLSDGGISGTIGFQLNNNSLEYLNGTNWGLATIGTVNLNTVYTISTKNRSITVNGTTYTATGGSAVTSPVAPMYFCQRSKFWYFRMTAADGITFVRDFVPAKRNSDDAVGMYDKINNVFYSGNFIAGPAA